MIVEALKQKGKSHGTQKRREGTAYLEGHVYPVTLSILNCPELEGRITPELVAGALLHDVLEDDETVDAYEFKRELACEPAAGEDSNSLFKI